MRDLLHVYMTTWENQEVLQDTITWYRQRVPDCKITVYDNMSADLTVEMCLDLGCQVRSFNTQGKMNEAILMKIRECCWLDPEHNSEFVIVCDDDEMVDVKLDKMEGWNVNHCVGYEMFGSEGDKLEDMKFGLPSAGYSKKLMWKRYEILAMNFGAGSHQSNPVAKEGFEIIYNPDPFACYHTKWSRGWNKGVSRQKRIGPRVDEESKRKNWNWHFNLPDKLEEGQTGLNHWDYFNNGFNNRVQVRFD